MPSAGRCVANLSGRWTPPPLPGGKWRGPSRTFNGAPSPAQRYLRSRDRDPEGGELVVLVDRSQPLALDRLHGPGACEHEPLRLPGLRLIEAWMGEEPEDCPPALGELVRPRV